MIFQLYILTKSDASIVLDVLGVLNSTKHEILNKMGKTGSDLEL